MLVGPNIGGVGDGRLAVGVVVQVLKDPVEHLESVPPRELRVHRLPGAESLR
jgi:hypothetical protein